MGNLNTITLKSGTVCKIYDRPILLGDTPVITVVKISETERKVRVYDNAYNEVGYNDLVFTKENFIDGLDLIVYIKSMIYRDAKIWIQSGDPVTEIFFKSLQKASFKDDIVPGYIDFVVK